VFLTLKNGISPFKTRKKGIYTEGGTKSQNVFEKHKQKLLDAVETLL
jgi:hypothetical protein